MNLSKDYADFIQQFQWNYFATCRTPYRINTMTGVKNHQRKAIPVNEIVNLMKKHKAIQ
ncbi:hypothetical protein N9L61_03590 [Flavobacteriaceae bacterium]|nr:hypothetical protein [Flavobacteriaceae bacterium]